MEIGLVGQTHIFTRQLKLEAAGMIIIATFCTVVGQTIALVDHSQGGRGSAMFPGNSELAWGDLADGKFVERIND